LSDLDWNSYDLVLLASGFEERSTFLLDNIPELSLRRTRVLGFWGDRDKLSRSENDRKYAEKGIDTFTADHPQAYEGFIKEKLYEAVAYAGLSRPTKILVDYSVMTRAWYGYILTWLRYATGPVEVDADFVYAHGEYTGAFEPLHIHQVTAISGFEGASAGTRNTVAAFGLGFDRYAMLALYEQIEPDSLVCFIAQDSIDDPKAARAIEDNKEIIELSGRDPVRLPLGHLGEIYRGLYECLSTIDASSEIVAVPMGPKPHVLGMLLVAQAIPRITCMHAGGYRNVPVQVIPTGKVSVWQLCYR